MRFLSLFLAFITLSYVSSASTDGRICPLGGKTPEECPDDNIWNQATCSFVCKPHCISNEGNFIFPNETTGGTGFRNQCNACTCVTGGTIGICTEMACDQSLCYDDAGNRYTEGDFITRGCKTATCTNVDGKGVWNWYDPATVPTKPNCPFGTAIYNSDTCQWDCPSTCDDGSTPECLVQPCANVRCGFNPVCVDNYCPNFPIPDKGQCTSTCVQPVQCAKDPCQSPPGQPKCGKGQVCEADYRFGCGYQCKAATCEFNGTSYQVDESRPSEDGCNTCSCTENGWVCTLKACDGPTDKPTCRILGGKVPPECPNNNKWNPDTCQFECLPHCVSNEGNFIFPGGDRFRVQCNLCSCAEGGVIGGCTKIGCDSSLCYDDQGKGYAQGSILTRGCKTATCGVNGQWKWIDPSTQTPPRCDLSPATWDADTCKWTCPQTCVDGTAPPLCTIHPCAAVLCAANSQCVVNQCSNYPNTEEGACTATCQPITQCFVSPCSVNSCGNGQTCVDDYIGGCGYRCIDNPTPVPVLTATFTLTWYGRQTAKAISSEMVRVAYEAGILSVFIINNSDIKKKAGINLKWSVKVGIKGTSRTEQLRSLKKFMNELFLQGHSAGGVTVNAQVMDVAPFAMDPEVSTSQGTMTMQSCEHGDIPADQTCPVNAMIPVATTTTSSSKSLVTIIAPIVASVVLLAAIASAVIIVRRRRAEAMKSINNMAAQQPAAVEMQTQA